jgi:hypothetical protein
MITNVIKLSNTPPLLLERAGVRRIKTKAKYFLISKMIQLKQNSPSYSPGSGYPVPWMVSLIRPCSLDSGTNLSGTDLH